MYLFTLKKAVYKSDRRIGPLDRHNVSCLEALALQRRDNRINADLIWSSFPRLILFMDVWVFFNSQNSLKKKSWDLLSLNLYTWDKAVVSDISSQGWVN